MSDIPTFTLLDSPDKSLIDKKNYRVIQLQNGLTATLISDLASLKEGEEIKEQIEDEKDESESEDPEIERYDEEAASDSCSTDDERSCDDNQHVEQEQYLPAAAIRIGAGSLEDPRDRGGMMHFLEHMVFMGSSKYPKESFFDCFIQRHGGFDNGFTQLESTTYYFEVQEEYLKKGLDVFAQFFISPLIKKEAISREKKAVHSEFQLALPDDECRMQHFYGSLARGDHPLSIFMWGNEETLDFNISDDDLQSQLFDLWKKYYTSAHMKLVVQARETLDTLQEWVTEIFSMIPNNNLPRPSYGHLSFPWDMDRWNKFYGIVPMKELTTVTLAWALPSLQSKYKSRPLEYISRLVADEGVGSILSILKKKMLALSLIAGAEDDESEDNTVFCLFTVTINLTEEGFKHMDTVVLTVFQYLNLMRRHPPLDRLFEEHRKLDMMDFNYESENTAVENVEKLVASMMMFPPKHFINGNKLTFDYEPQEIINVLNLLTPEKSNIIAQSKNYGRNGQTDETEKWFGIKFFSKDIPSEWKTLWDQNPINPDLSFPPPNPYVTSNFTILPSVSNAPEYPVKIKEDNFGELWYKQDQKFNLPKGACVIYWINEDWRSSAKMAALMNLYVNLYHHIYTEPNFPIYEALFDHSIAPDDMGVVIKLSGFNEKFVDCLQLFRTQMNDLLKNLNEDNFNLIKKQVLKFYHDCLISPEKLRSDIRLGLLLDAHWQLAERLLALDTIDIISFRNEVETLFDCYYTKILVQGNFTAAEAEQMYDIMASKNPASKGKLFEMKTKKLEIGSQSVRVAGFNQTDANSSVVNYYQDGPGDMWKEVVNQFLLYLMSEPSFDFLRTKETLGYSVSCSSRCTYGILGFSVTVNFTADKHSVDLVDSKIEEFLAYFKNYVRKMNSLEFNEFRSSFQNEKLIIDLALADEMKRNWEEIASGEFVFDRLQKQHDLIPKITRDNVLSKLAQLTVSKTETYRKLSIQVEGSEMPEWNKCPEYENTLKLPYEDVVRCMEPDDGERAPTKFIVDLRSYKNSLQYHPVTKIC